MEEKKPKPRGKPFEKGNKLGGRKPTPQEFKDLAQGYSVTALQKVIEIIEAETTDTKDRLKAIEIVLDRGIGKPVQALDIESNNTNTGIITIKLEGELGEWAK